MIDYPAGNYGILSNGKAKKKGIRPPSDVSLNVCP